MSLHESQGDRERGAGKSDKPQSRELTERPMRADGFAAHDDFQPPNRKAGLAILDYEEGESI
ncbi:hypothetical protein BH11PSE7_BH11PSE7_37960 [soil metagenome]